MKHFIARGARFVAVFSASNEVEAARIVLALFAAAGIEAEAMEVMEFDPSVEGGVLLDVNEGREAARI